MLNEKETNKILEWIGDDHAYSFFTQVCTAFEFWDDLIDKDKPITDYHINSTMFSLLVTLPSNPFFIAHRANILPVLATITASWAHLIPKLESKEQGSKKTAYAVRRCVTNNVDLLMYIIFLVRGMHYVAEISGDIADFIAAKDELFSEYVDGLPVQRS